MLNQWPLPKLAPRRPITGLQPQGVLIRRRQGARSGTDHGEVLRALRVPDLAPFVDSEMGSDAAGYYDRIWLIDSYADRLTPAFSTLQLRQTLHLEGADAEDDLIREIVVALLAGPIPHAFPSVEELQSAVRMRRNIVVAARRTVLAFDTAQADRPPQYWHYDEDRGFVIRPNTSLITALTCATQPAVGEPLYTFSCYRATEYVILLGMAQEVRRCNPGLYQQLQRMWMCRPIKSCEFHEVFLREQGAMDDPLPPGYYVPGDRVWFRNPDAASAEVTGYEGSWVFYLGGGRFTNFWQPGRPYTLADKCLEIYHWRNGVRRDASGAECMDEHAVHSLVEATRAHPAEMSRILQLMQRFREPQGIYTSAGGCIDVTRECVRWVRPATSDLRLPDIA